MSHIRSPHDVDDLRHRQIPADDLAEARDQFFKVGGDVRSGVGHRILRVLLGASLGRSRDATK